MNIIKNNEYIDVSEEFVQQLQNKKLIYEVIRIIDGIPLFFHDHIKRLNNSLNILQIKAADEKNIELMLKKLIKNSRIDFGNIKIVLDFINNDIYAFFIPHKYPSGSEYLKGVKTIFYFGERNNPNAKIMDISFRENVNKKIEENNVYEAILVNNEGYITEGSKSNIFLVKGDTLFTSYNKQVLPGITREKIFYLCSKHGINVIENNISYKDIEYFDGLFISGTSPKILPIKAVNQISFSSADNKVILNLSKFYNLLINEYINKHKSV